MPEHNIFWIDKAFKRIPLPYQVISTIVSLSIYLIYNFFSMRVDFFPMESYHRIEVCALSILIGFQLLGLQYFLNRMNKHFDYFLPKETPIIYHYAIYFMIIFSYLSVILIRVANGEDPFFYTRNQGYWELMLDIFNQATILSSLILLSSVLWMIFNIFYVLSNIADDREQNRINIDLFSLDRIGGLNPLKSFILAITIFYLINIMLMIMSYITPLGYFTYESILFIILLLVGLAFFLGGFMEIRRILECNIESQFHLITMDNKIMKRKFKEIISEERYSESVDELNSISTGLSILDSEREKLLNINVKIYDIPTISAFLITFLVTIMTFLQKLYELQSTGLIQQFLGYLK